jgi:hypothetical protein
VIKLRYTKGSGTPPIHLASIDWGNPESGEFIFSGACEHREPFTSRPRFLSRLQQLIQQRVPLAIGGMCPGPADEVALLIAKKELQGLYIELSWTGSQRWILREVSGDSEQWELEPDASKIANSTYNPMTLNGSD